MSNNNNSNTMELDSILSEARSRRSSAAGKSASAPQKANISRSKAVYADPDKTFADNFVLTNDDYSEYSAPQQKSPKKKAQTQKKVAAQPKKKRKTGLIVGACITGVVLVAAIAGVTFYLNSGSGTGPDSTFSDNVYVNGKSLKDLTVADAKKLMASVEDELADGIKVTVKAGDQTFDYGKNDFKYTFDTDAVLAEAKAYSEERGIKKEDKNYEIKMTVSDSTCESIVNGIADKVDTEAKDAQVTDFDPSADNMFTVSDEKNGLTLNKKESTNALSEFIKSGKISGTVDAKVEETKPEYTAAYLKENIIKLSSFSTYSTNNSNGNENMRISLKACNGSVIEPGETWSFNNCTGDSNLESNGYKPAGVIIQGRSETGIGGGICQSSTTIYNAAMLCGMEVVERACHYYKSTYVDAGLDATIDYGNIDLKMKNPFKYQLFMKCWMDGTELNCEMYGLRNPDFDEVKITTTDPSYFSNGYTVHTTRTFYKDGEKVSSDEMPSSTYYTSAPSSGGSSSGGSSGGSSDSDNSSSSSDSDSGSDTSSNEQPAAEEPAPQQTAEEPAQQTPAESTE